MGYNNEYADASPIVVDLETAGLPNAEDYLEPVEADKRLRDPVKISEDIAAKLQARIERMSLDCNVGRIAALGWWTAEDGTQIRLCQTEADEKSHLEEFWRECRHRTIVGFNIKGFDMRFLVQRSRYLGVPYPVLDFSKYSKKGITDLFLELTFGDGHYDSGVMRRTLKQFCKRFGIPVEDDVDGKEVPALVAAGDWGAVVSHLRSDVALTVALADKLRVIDVTQQEQAAIW